MEDAVTPRRDTSSRSAFVDRDPPAAPRPRIVVWTTVGKEVGPEFGEMLLDVLSNLGFSPTLLRDKHRDVQDADVLLLVGDCAHFDGSLLGRRTGRRLATILWQVAPLPLRTLSERAEQVGLRAARIDRVVWPSGWLLRLITSAVPRPVRASVGRAMLSTIFHAFKRQMATGSHAADNAVAVHVDRAMILRWAWFKRDFPKTGIDRVFVSSVPQAQFLASKGILADFVPVRYHPGMGEHLQMERDIDVVFIGRLGRRRRAILSDLQRRLAGNGVGLVIVDHGCYGRQRSELLNRARISLNVCDYPWELPGIRFLMSMGCGALVVSERLDDPTPYRVGEHFAQASIADLPDALGYYTEHEGAREAIARSAFSFVTRELTLRQSVSQIIRAFSADTGAVTDSIT